MTYCVVYFNGHSRTFPQPHYFEAIRAAMRAGGCVDVVDMDGEAATLNTARVDSVCLSTPETRAARLLFEESLGHEDTKEAWES